MTSRSILFVCAANRCRSPLAMALLQDLVRQQNEDEKWRIESAGLHAIDDLPVTPSLLTATQDAGLDLRQHRSRSIDQVRLSDYDLILTMEQIQAEALASAYPLMAQKIRPFSTIVGLMVDIDDPTGRGLREHRALVGLLKRYLQAGWPRLQQLMP